MLLPLRGSGTVESGEAGSQVQAAAAFLDAWGAEHAERVWLIQIDITQPVMLTLRFATRELFTPDGNFWQGRIREISPIRDGGSYLSPGPNLSSFDFDLDNEEIAESSGVKLASMLSAHVVQGAVVTLYLWERSLTSFGDVYQRFTGVVNRPGPVVAESQTVTFNALQDRRWNLRIPTKRVTRKAFPQAPESSLGAFLGLALGDWRTLPMRTPWTSNFGSKKHHEDVGGSEPKLPMVVADKGAGALPIKAYVAEHAVSLIDSALGARGQIRSGGQFDAMLDDFITDYFSGSNGSGLIIPDETLRAFAAVVPVDVRVLGTFKNTALNPKNALDPLDEQSYALIDSSASQGRLQLMLPNLSSLGDIESVEGVIGYQYVSGSGQLNFKPVKVSDNSGPTAIAVAASSTPTTVRGAWSTAWWTRNWEFGNTADKGAIDLLVEASGAGIVAKIFFVGLAVRFRPSLTLIAAPGASSGGRASLGLGGSGGPLPYVGPPPGGRGSLGYPDLTSTGVPGGVYEQRSPVFVNLVGPIDPSNYTTTPGNVIERHTDVARYLLSVYGGLDKDVDFELGVGALGSFVDARNALKTMEGSDYSASVFLNHQERIDAMVRRLGEEALCEFELDPATGQWHALPWVRQPQPTYRTLYRDDLESLQVDSMSDTELSQSIAIEYAVSPGSNRHLLRAFLDRDQSDMGFLERADGDQLLQVVSGVTDTLKFSPGVGTKTAVVSPGTYLSGLALAAEIRLRMWLADAEAWAVGYGTAIADGYQDQITVLVGATDYTATLRPYEYTPVNQAREATSQLNAAGTGLTWTVTYSHTTQKFTIAATGPFTLRLTSIARNALPVLGFMLGADQTDAGAPFSIVGNSARNQEHFWISTTQDGAGLYLSDAVVPGTTIQALIGALDVDLANLFAANGRSFMAGRRRGVRQSRAVASIARYGERQPVERQSQTVRVWNVAGDWRDRLFDFLYLAKARVTLVSRRVPDLRRGDVFQLDAESIDQWAPYIMPESSGSHEGRVYRVIEVVQHNGPQDASAHVVAVEMDSSAPIAAPAPGSSSVFLASATGSIGQHSVQEFTSEGQPVWASPTQVSNSAFAITSISHAIIPDDGGGCFIAFNVDTVSSHDDVRCVRLDATGAVAAGWTIGGTPVSVQATSGNNKGLVRICPDGLGGVIVAWRDFRNHASISDVYAQRLDGNGAPQWPTDGVRISDISLNIGQIRMIPDGLGGAFISYYESSGTLDRCYCTRVLANGTIATGFGVTGLEIASASSDFLGLGICTDAAGGAYVAASTGSAVALARVRPDGAFASGFPISDLATAGGNTYQCDVVVNGNGGALVAWKQANTSPALTESLVVQSVSPAGSLLLAAGGVRITGDESTGGIAFDNPVFAQDFLSGVLVAWERGGTHQEVYVQRATNTGARLFGTDGALILDGDAVGGFSVQRLALVGVGDGGAWVAWDDGRTSGGGGSSDTILQRVSASGVPLLAANGLTVDSATHTLNSLAHPITTPTQSQGGSPAPEE